MNTTSLLNVIYSRNPRIGQYIKIYLYIEHDEYGYLSSTTEDRLIIERDKYNYLKIWIFCEKVIINKIKRQMTNCNLFLSIFSYTQRSINQ